MYKIFSIIIFIQMLSCTDQGDPIVYSVENSSNFDTKILLFDKLGKNDTILIHKSESRVMDQDSPPYDNGPFSDKDSIKVIFADLKILTYKPLRSKNDCPDSEKNPFCQYSHYICNINNCIFEIDNIEYLKAK